MSLRFHTNDFQKGQNLSEYGLAIGLTVIVGIAGLSLLGTQVSGLLGNTIGARRTAPPQLASVPVTPANPGAFSGQKGFFITAAEIDAILDGAPTQTIPLGNGKNISIPNPALKELQETLGPNGSTEVALAMIERLKKALVEAGIDPQTIIPELSFFAKTGHKMSDKQKEGETYLTNTYSPDSSKIVDLYATMGGYSREINRSGGFFQSREVQQLQFSQADNGNFFVSHFIDGLGKTIDSPKLVSEFSVPDRLFYAGELTKKKLQTDQNLQSLLSPFNKILDTINQNTTDIAYENRVRSFPYAGEIKDPAWLSTKIESNKACVMSKDQSCLR